MKDVDRISYDHDGGWDVADFTRNCFKPLMKWGGIMFGLGPMEIGLILVIIMVVFGAGKLPGVMADLAKGLRNFRDEVTDDKSRP
jgi:sec-independent protein translocase protein TatA